MARTDIANAIEWYQERGSQTLAQEFSEEIFQAVESLRERATSNPFKSKKFNVRRVNTKRFPYSIIYRIEGKKVIIFAVVHTAQDERVWVKRL